MRRMDGRKESCALIADFKVIRVVLCACPSLRVSLAVEAGVRAELVPLLPRPEARFEKLALA